MIPKVIHYIWFGKNPLPELAVKCIESWKKYCPDYEIIEWNEDNFDINSNLYVQQALEAKKYAFASDYARLKVLYEFGGIYMDTDVEVTQNLDKFLQHEAFSGFESSKAIPTGIMGGQKNSEILKELLEFYSNKPFILDDGSFDMTTNVVIITNILLQYGLKLNNEFQVVRNFVLYPSDYFCPKNGSTLEINITNNTHAIHHFNGSWLEPLDKLLLTKNGVLRKKYGDALGQMLYRLYFLVMHIKVNGFAKTMSVISKKYKMRNS